MTREPDDPDRPREPTASDVDAAFAQIVASWHEPPPQWPSESDQSGSGPSGSGPSGSGPSGSGPSGSGPSGSVDDDAAPTEEIPAVDDDDDHFVPPEPPPLPRPQPATIGAVLLFALGIVLLAIPNMIGFSEQYGLPLGLLSITGAIVWLVARLRQGPPTDSGWDDGAQL